MLEYIFGAESRILAGGIGCQGGCACAQEMDQCQVIVERGHLCPYSTVWGRVFFFSFLS